MKYWIFRERTVGQHSRLTLTDHHLFVYQGDELPFDLFPYREIELVGRYIGGSNIYEMLKEFADQPFNQALPYHHDFHIVSSITIKPGLYLVLITEASGGA